VGRLSKPARRAVSGYLPYMSVDPTNAARRCPESNPDFQSAELVSSRWTMSPQLFLVCSSLRRSRISRSSLALNRPLALPIHRKLVHMVHRTFRRRLPAVFRRRLIVDRPGNRTPISWLQARCLPVGPAAQVSRGPSGNRTRSPSLPRRCAAGTPTDLRVIPAGVEPALSCTSRRRLRHWTTGSCQ
jgi:hypothetical protein